MSTPSIATGPGGALDAEHGEPTAKVMSETKEMVTKLSTKTLSLSPLSQPTLTSCPAMQLNLLVTVASPVMPPLPPQVETDSKGAAISVYHQHHHG